MLFLIKNNFFTHRFIFCSLLLIAISVSSCRKLEHEKIVADAVPYQPTNLYPIERLPAYFNRVVVLPNFHSDPSSQVLSFSNDIFLKELSKVGLFETVYLSEKSCLEHFGQKRFGSTESLPENFLNILNQEYGANGVLFIDLHTYSPYRPLSLGVRAKLVDLKSGEFMWAIDETIDAGSASVMVVANNYQRTDHVQAISSKTSSSVLQSPRVFCKFVAHVIFSTLPSR